MANVSHCAIHVASKLYLFIAEPFVAWELNFRLDDEKSSASRCVIPQLLYNSDSLTQNPT